MDDRLRRHLNAQLQYLVERAAQRIRPGVVRLAVVWDCCKQLHDKANSDPERRFWREYMAHLERRAEEMHLEKQREEDLRDPFMQRRIAQAWRAGAGKGKLLS